MTSAATGELLLGDTVLTDYSEVKDEDRAVVYKTRQRILNGEHGAKYEQLPEHMRSFRLLSRLQQRVLLYDNVDGKFQGVMNSFGEKMREAPDKHRVRSQQRAEERAAAVLGAARGAVDLVAAAVAPLAVRRITGDAAALQNDDDEETEHRQQQQQRRQEVQRGRMWITIAEMDTAISKLDNERKDHLDLLVDELEIQFNNILEIWEQVRAPKYEKIARHEDEQLQKKVEDENHNYEDLPEIQELLRIFPMRIETEFRDKFGNITVFVVPHCGGSKMAEEEIYRKTDPKRFKELLLYFNEYLEVLKDELSEKEKRIVHVNWVWDVKPLSPFWTNDGFVGLVNFLRPALDEVGRCYSHAASDTIFFVNTFTWYAYFIDKYRGIVSVLCGCNAQCCLRSVFFVEFSILSISLIFSLPLCLSRIH